MASGRKPKGKHPDKKLSPAFVHKTTKPGRYCDGNGLYLKVDPSGARRWEQRLVIQGRQRTLGLGGVQLVSLSEAREKALANRKIARAGGDPMDLRRQANIPTFEAAAAAVIELHRPSWRNAKHASQWETTLRTYVYPRLGKRPVSDIDTAEVLSVLMAIWHDQGGNRAACAPTHLDRHEMGRGPRLPAGQPCRRGHQCCAAQAEWQRQAPSPGPAARRSRRRHRGRTRVWKRKGCQAGLRVPDPDRRTIWRGPAYDVERGRHGRGNLDRSG